MEFIYKNKITAEEYNFLREAVGWGSLCQEQAEASLVNSAYVVGCYHQDKIVGAARIIWDRGYIAYLADVMVLPAYQGKGIGRQMIEKAISFIQSQLREGWRIKIVLVSAKGKESFYQKFGFRERPNESDGAGMDLWVEPK